MLCLGHNVVLCAKFPPSRNSHRAGRCSCLFSTTVVRRDRRFFIGPFSLLYGQMYCVSTVQHTVG
jgi:hypothetical protein